MLAVRSLNLCLEQNQSPGQCKQQGKRTSGQAIVKMVHSSCFEASVQTHRRHHFPVEDSFTLKQRPPLDLLFLDRLICLSAPYRPPLAPTGVMPPPRYNKVLIPGSLPQGKGKPPPKSKRTYDSARSEIFPYPALSPTEKNLHDVVFPIAIIKAYF